MAEFRVGRHLNVTRGLVTASWYAQETETNIFQIFLGVPKFVLSKARQKKDLLEFADQIKERDQKMVVHSSYTINLANPIDSKKFEMSLKSLVQDLQAVEIIGSNCLGVVIHMGKNVTANNISDDDAIDNYIHGIKEALSSTETANIILETGASQGSEICSEIEGLAEIYWRLEDEERKRVYFCIDTCHIWATGYDISDKDGVNNFFEKFEDMIGIDRIICIHFNDSKTPLESHVDRHADLGYGMIGKHGLAAIAKFAKKNKIPLIMETPLDAIKKTTNSEISWLDELLLVKSWLK